MSSFLKNSCSKVQVPSSTLNWLFAAIRFFSNYGLPVHIKTNNIPSDWSPKACLQATILLWLCIGCNGNCQIYQMHWKCWELQQTVADWKETCVPWVLQGEHCYNDSGDTKLDMLDLTGSFMPSSQWCAIPAIVDSNSIPIPDQTLQFNSDSNCTLENISSIPFQFQFHPWKYEFSIQFRFQFHHVILAFDSIPIPIP